MKLFRASGRVVLLVLLWAVPAVSIACGPGVDESDNEWVRGRGEGKDRWFDQLPRPAWSSFERVEQSQKWFEVYRIQPGVFAIYEPGQFEEVISYLIVGAEKALLWDSGLGIGDMRSLVSELTEFDPILINSHSHYDHIGGNHQFSAIYGTGSEYSTQKALGASHEEVAYAVGEGWIWKDTPPGFVAQAYRIEPYRVTRTVKDGDRIDLGGRVLEVLVTPGHSPDALCLLDRENRLLWTGDTYYPATLYAHLEGSDFDLYLRTAERLADLASSVDRLLPSHNEPWAPGDDLVRMRDAFRAVRDAAVPFVLTDGNREYSFDGFSILVPAPTGN